MLQWLIAQEFVTAVKTIGIIIAIACAAFIIFRFAISIIGAVLKLFDKK